MFPSNSSIEIVYYAVSDGYCYSAFAISSLLNNLSAEQFNRITLESAIIKAARMYMICITMILLLLYYTIS